eukprot:scaffold306_cov525-Prasinococcus_capsulatus_cf.AAC.35
MEDPTRGRGVEAWLWAGAPLSVRRTCKVLMGLPARHLQRTCPFKMCVTVRVCAASTGGSPRHPDAPAVLHHIDVERAAGDAVRELRAAQHGEAALKVRAADARGAGALRQVLRECVHA